MLLLLLLLVASTVRCGPNSRIIGGELAIAGEFPYAAAIYITTSTGNYFCAGVVMSARWILTAGQCIDGALQFTVILGTNKLDDSESTQVTAIANEYVLHPDYDPLTLSNDIGLIMLRERVTYTDYIKGISLPYLEVWEGQPSIAFGWGQTSDEFSGLAPSLNRVNLTALSDEECKRYYGAQIKENMFCFTGNYNEGTCYGDSGSPVIVKVTEDYVVVSAIATFFSGNGCESTDPSGYTQIFPYSPWIMSYAYGIP